MTSSLSNIVVKGASEHNLKKVDLEIPRDKLVVFTGVSGSGKSSLVFNTIFAEGQRRFIESASSYARQFLGKLNKPNVENISGIPPAIAIEQKPSSNSSRSTVGTLSEIYDYLKILFGRIGKIYSPVSGNPVIVNNVTDVINYIKKFDPNYKGIIYAEFILKKEHSIENELKSLMSQGFTKIKVKNEIIEIDEILSKKNIKFNKREFYLHFDRIGFDLAENEKNISESIENAFNEGTGRILFEVYNEKLEKKDEKIFSNKLELDGIIFEQININLFTFNNSYGVCKKCEGTSKIIGFDENLIIPNKNLSVFQKCVECWKVDTSNKFINKFIDTASKFDFPIHKPYSELNDEQKKLLWHGNETVKGIYFFLNNLSIFDYGSRRLFARFIGKTECDECLGSRLKKEALYVKIGGKNIRDIVNFEISEALEFFNNLKLDKYDSTIAKIPLFEIRLRLNYLNDIGLSYLTLNRAASTLSGGESQRVNLARQLGNCLTGSLYVLDEPSIGLHPKDTEKLIQTIKNLRDKGNTIFVVEHDEEIIRNADEIIDLGPKAGNLGGEIVFQGNLKKMLSESDSITAKYLKRELEVNLNRKPKTLTNFITIRNACANNLKNLTINIPTNCLTVISGVSGSGKTSLVKEEILPKLKNINNLGNDKNLVSGNIHEFNLIEFIEQDSIGRSNRSNPLTFSGGFEPLRMLFSKQPIAIANNLNPSHFSFNVSIGCCSTCSGEGVIKIDMQFMPDVYNECEDCKGMRYKKEVLEVTYLNKNINDILNMTIDEAIEFFKTDILNNYVKNIINSLEPLQKVGLGYMKLGQASSTFSGGEAQRVKLASYLKFNNNLFDKILFIFDEPTTGLHFYDIQNLLTCFELLILQGHSILIIEHNLEVIKLADWVIELGPESGKNGGELIFSGTVADLLKNKKSQTAKYLLKSLKNDN